MIPTVSKHFKIEIAACAHYWVREGSKACLRLSSASAEVERDHSWLAAVLAGTGGARVLPARLMILYWSSASRSRHGGPLFLSACSDRFLWAGQRGEITFEAGSLSVQTEDAVKIENYNQVYASELFCPFSLREFKDRILYTMQLGFELHMRCSSSFMDNQALF